MEEVTSPDNMEYVHHGDLGKGKPQIELRCDWGKLNFRSFLYQEAVLYLYLSRRDPQ